MDNIAQNEVIQDTAKPQGGKRLIFLLVATLAILIILIVLVSRYLPQQQVKVVPKTQTKSSTPNYSANLEKTIKTTFSDSKYKAIIDYTNLASREKDIDQRYNYYVKIFKKASEAYQQTKNPQFKLVLYQLKDYVKVFPKYQEADFIIPI